MPRKTVTEADIHSLEFWTRTIRKLNKQTWDVQDHGNMLDRVIYVRCPRELAPKLEKMAERFGFYSNVMDDFAEEEEWMAGITAVEIGQGLDIPFAEIERTARMAQEAMGELTDALGLTPETDA